jgi:hypothetical protein
MIERGMLEGRYGEYTVTGAADEGDTVADEDIE